MKKSNLIILISTALFILALAIAGCSDNDILAPAPEPLENQSGITAYFPLNAGYTSTYEVRDADGRVATTTFRVGAEVPFGDSVATLWFYETATGYDTSFVVVDNAGLYLYEGVNSAGERILQGPLSPGSAWTRYPGLENNDTTSIVTGETDLGDILTDDGGNGGAATKVFPTTGSNELRVAAVETIVLANGDAYAGAVRVVNQMSDGSTNQYWFAPSYGLVRYVLGGTASYPNGRQVGELVSFSK